MVETRVGKKLYRRLHHWPNSKKKASSPIRAPIKSRCCGALRSIWIGLPAHARKRTQAFVADQSPDAFRESRRPPASSFCTHYGERWGREWLDVARYADTNGFKADEVRPNIWRYRDYVIQAFNQDKPYDSGCAHSASKSPGMRCTPTTSDAHIATGFLRHYTDETNQPSMEERREELLMNITDTVGSAFMGMTFGCAKCHDHKFDPILHKDYYRLQAFFVSNVRAGRSVHPSHRRRSSRR